MRSISSALFLSAGVDASFRTASAALSEVSLTEALLLILRGHMDWMTISPTKLKAESAITRFLLIEIGDFIPDRIVDRFVSPHCVVLMFMFILSSRGV